MIELNAMQIATSAKTKVDHLEKQLDKDIGRLDRHLCAMRGERTVQHIQLSEKISDGMKEVHKRIDRFLWGWLGVSGAVIMLLIGVLFKLGNLGE